MARQLFLHHYFPALYFAILLFCGVFDLLTSALRPRIRLQIALVLIIMAIWNFHHLSPLAYGNPWTKSQCEKAKWLKTWDFSCNDFYDTYEQYNPGVVTTATSPVLTTIVDDVRPPVVVVDHKKQEQKKNDQSTTAILHKAEPGRDVFAEGADKDSKSSSHVPPEQPKEKEEKQISSVGVVPTDDKNRNGIVAFESKPVIISSTTVSTDAATEGVVKDKPKARAGAPDEAEVEAEKAAKELFPETTS